MGSTSSFSPQRILLTKHEKWFNRLKIRTKEAKNMKELEEIQTEFTALSDF